MEQLKIGDILHCSGKGTLSKLIRFFTKSKISHTAVFIEVWGKPYIIDAQKDGVNVRPYDEWMKTFQYDFIVTRFLAPLDEKAYCIKAMSMSGHTAYDFKGLLIKHPWKLITGNYKRERNPTERMYCSEYVAWTYGITDFYRLTPKDLYARCILNGCNIVFLHKQL